MFGITHSGQSTVHIPNQALAFRGYNNNGNDYGFAPIVTEQGPGVGLLSMWGIHVESITGVINTVFRDLSTDQPWVSHEYFRRISFPVQLMFMTENEVIWCGVSPRNDEVPVPRFRPYIFEFSPPASYLPQPVKLRRPSIHPYSETFITFDSITHFDTEKFNRPVLAALIDGEWSPYTIPRSHPRTDDRLYAVHQEIGPKGPGYTLSHLPLSDTRKAELLGEKAKAPTPGKVPDPTDNKAGKEPAHPVRPISAPQPPAANPRHHSPFTEQQRGIPFVNRWTIAGVLVITLAIAGWATGFIPEKVNQAKNAIASLSEKAKNIQVPSFLNPLGDHTYPCRVEDAVGNYGLGIFKEPDSTKGSEDDRVVVQGFFAGDHFTCISEPVQDPFDTDMTWTRVRRNDGVEGFAKISNDGEVFIVRLRKEE